MKSINTFAKLFGSVFTLAVVVSVLTLSIMTASQIYGNSEAEWTCIGDLDKNGNIDSGDVSLVLLDFGDCYECESDLDQDSVVSSADLALILISSGPCQDLVSPRFIPADGSLTPTTIDVTASSADVTVRLHVIDPETGVVQVGARLHYNEQSLGSIYSNFHLVSGTAYDGIWENTFVIPQGAPSGVWHLREGIAWDVPGNTTYLYGDNVSLANTLTVMTH